MHDYKSNKIEAFGKTFRIAYVEIRKMLNDLNLAEESEHLSEETTYLDFISMHFPEDKVLSLVTQNHKSELK